MIHCALCFHNQVDFYQNVYITMLSCFQRTASPLHMHLVTDGSVEPYKEYYQALCAEYGVALSFYSPPTLPPDVAALFRGNAIAAYTPASLYRLFLHEIIPADTLVYMDGDIVFERDIADLAAFDLGEAWALAAHDPSRSWSPHKRSYYLKCLHINENRYFNSGVLSMNLRRLRRDSGNGNVFMDYYRQLAPLARTLPYAIYDQDLLNAMLSRDEDKLLLVGPEFNYELCLHQRRFLPLEALENKILHFAALKPWAKFFPVSLAYWRLHAQSPWADQTFARINQRLQDRSDPGMSTAMFLWKQAGRLRGLRKLLP